MHHPIRAKKQWNTEISNFTKNWAHLVEWGGYLLSLSQPGVSIEKGQLFICLSIEIYMVTYFAAWAGVSFSRSYISSSQSMNFAYRLLTMSKESYKT